MGKKDTHVKHEGTITQIDGTTVYVRIIQHSACAGCHVQSCMYGSRPQRKNHRNHLLHTRSVRRTTSMGVGNEAMSNEALRLAFLYPFLVICCVLAGIYLLTGDEAVSGITALLSLLPYYLTLYLFRKKIRKSLVFTVEPLRKNENL